MSIKWCSKGEKKSRELWDLVYSHVWTPSPGSILLHTNETQPCQQALARPEGEEPGEATSAAPSTCQRESHLRTSDTFWEGETGSEGTAVKAALTVAWLTGWKVKKKTNFGFPHFKEIKYNESRIFAAPFVPSISQQRLSQICPETHW